MRCGGNRSARRIAWKFKRLRAIENMMHLVSTHSAIVALGRQSIAKAGNRPSEYITLNIHASLRLLPLDKGRCPRPPRAEGFDCFVKQHTTESLMRFVSMHKQ